MSYFLIIKFFQTEYPVPEQFKTKITNKGLSTTAVDALG